MLLTQMDVEEVLIIEAGDDVICVGLHSVREGQAKLAIKAPEDIRIFRAEQYQRVHGGKLIRVCDLRSGSK